MNWPGLSRFVDEAWRPLFLMLPGGRMRSKPPDQSALEVDAETGLEALSPAGTSVHILWQDLSGKASIGETGQALSQLARHCLELGARVPAERRVED